MLININFEDLTELVENFHTITNTTVAIYDGNGNMVTASRDPMCKFCNEIRTIPELDQKCLASDHYALNECSRTKKAYIYKCHMDLIEIAIPIICNEIIIGYMLFGQITNQSDTSVFKDHIKETAQQYNLNQEYLLELTKEIPYCSDEYITSISNLMKIGASYIWSNNIMNLTTNSLAHNIELFIENHLQEDLSIASLCEYFNMTRSALYTLSKENFKMGITEYVQYCRLKAAKKLFKTQPHLSVAEVSELVGIKDSSYFSRFFKLQTGLTPKQYQLKHKNANFL